MISSGASCKRCYYINNGIYRPPAYYKLRLFPGRETYYLEWPNMAERLGRRDQEGETIYVASLVYEEEGAVGLVV